MRPKILKMHLPKLCPVMPLQSNQVVIIIGVIINENKLLLIAESKAIRFDLPKDVGKNLRHEIDFILKHNEFLA